EDVFRLDVPVEVQEVRAAEVNAVAPADPPDLLAIVVAADPVEPAGERVARLRVEGEFGLLDPQDADAAAPERRRVHVQIAADALEPVDGAVALADRVPAAP